jgi:hypothetical protein
MATVKKLCRQAEVSQPLDELIRRLNQAVRGWCAYFRPGFVGDFRLSEPLPVDDGMALAETQTPPGHVEGTTPPLLPTCTHQ